MTSRQVRVVHMTSAHPRSDTRIFLKQCRSLVLAGFDTALVVADGLGDEIREGVRIFDVGRSRGRLWRMLLASHRVAVAAEALGGDIYQGHDPELLPALVRMSARGYRTVFDSHEDYSESIGNRPYIPSWARRSAGRLFGAYESKALRRLSAVIAATPHIAAKFRAKGVQSTVVNNYPLHGELVAPVSSGGREDIACFVGVMSDLRGIQVLVRAMSHVRSNARLMLVGSFDPPDFEAVCRRESGWSRVEFVGKLDRSALATVLARARCGVVTYLPDGNHVHSQPNKLFEYLSAGLPVVASNFPGWFEIVEGSRCGICVDPTDPLAVAAAIDRLVGDTDGAEMMGRRGLKLVESRLSWESEEGALLRLYESILNPGSSV